MISKGTVDPAGLIPLTINVTTANYLDRINEVQQKLREVELPSLFAQSTLIDDAIIICVSENYRGLRITYEANIDPQLDLVSEIQKRLQPIADACICPLDVVGVHRPACKDDFELHNGFALHIFPSKETYEEAQQLYYLQSAISRAMEYAAKHPDLDKFKKLMETAIFIAIEK